MGIHPTMLVCVTTISLNSIGWVKVWQKYRIYIKMVVRLEPNMLKNLPIIPSQTFYSVVSMMISQCRSDYTYNLHSD